MTRALETERREHELTRKALEISRWITQQMHAIWDDIMTNSLVIPNYMHASEGEVQAHAETEELLHQEFQREAKPSQGDDVQPLEDEAEEDADEEEKDH